MRARVEKVDVLGWNKSLRIYTDHKNLTCKHFNTGVLLIWRLIVKDYNPDIECIQGGGNIVADRLSTFPLYDN